MMFAAFLRRRTGLLYQCRPDKNHTADSLSTTLCDNIVHKATVANVGNDGHDDCGDDNLDFLDYAPVQTGCAFLGQNLARDMR